MNCIYLNKYYIFLNSKNTINALFYICRDKKIKIKIDFRKKCRKTEKKTCPIFLMGSTHSGPATGRREIFFLYFSLINST